MAAGNNNKKKSYKTREVLFTISKKQKGDILNFLLIENSNFECSNINWHTLKKKVSTNT